MDAEDLDLVKRPEKFQTYGGYSKEMIFTLSLSFSHCNNYGSEQNWHLLAIFNEPYKGLFRGLSISCRLKTLKNT